MQLVREGVRRLDKQSEILEVLIRNRAENIVSQI